MNETLQDNTSDSQPETMPFLPRRKKFLVPIILLLTVVIFGLGLGLVYAFTSAKQTEPYKLTMRTLQDRPEVKQHVGVPLESRFIVLGKVDEGDGVADLMFKIRGPVGEAAVRSRLERVDGAWTIRHLDMGIGGRDDGEIITMIGDPDALPQ
ncbi:MAG: cytochrome c oxidase assembly factor Coa1 family protein [Phycisphaerales bacterium JB063]